MATTGENRKRAPKKKAPSRGQSKGARVQANGRGMRIGSQQTMTSKEANKGQEQRRNSRKERRQKLIFCRWVVKDDKLRDELRMLIDLYSILRVQIGTFASLGAKTSVGWNCTISYLLDYGNDKVSNKRCQTSYWDDLYRLGGSCSEGHPKGNNERGSK